MLLIDGVKYEEWTPNSEDEFENEVMTHASEIFGGNAKYFDLKHKLASKTGTGSIPDGYVLTFDDKPQLRIIELELASHSREHIVNQIINITNGIENPATQVKICNRIEDEIRENSLITMQIEKAISPVSIHRFLSNCFSDGLATITVVIDHSVPKLDEALSKLAKAPKIIEFISFRRVGAETIHAHMFDPLYPEAKAERAPTNLPVKDGLPEVISTVRASDIGITKTSEPATKARIVKFQELINRNLLKDGQILYFHHNTRIFREERATVSASSNKLRYEGDGEVYSKSELAKILLIKHGLTRTDAVRGPLYWSTEDNKVLADLEEQLRLQRGDRTGLGK